MHDGVNKTAPFTPAAPDPSHAYDSHGKRRDEIEGLMDGHKAFEIACGTYRPRRRSTPRPSP
jgi:hypothetical protein